MCFIYERERDHSAWIVTSVQMGSHSCLDCGDITKKSHYNTGNYCHCPITASTSYPKFKVWFLILLLAAAVLWHTVTKWPGSTFLPLYNYWHLFDYTLVFQVSTTCNLLTLSESQVYNYIIHTCITQSACKFHLTCCWCGALIFHTNTNWSDYGTIFKSGNMKLDKAEL